MMFIFFQTVNVMYQKCVYKKKKFKKKRKILNLVYISVMDKFLHRLVSGDYPASRYLTPIAYPNQSARRYHQTCLM